MRLSIILLTAASAAPLAAQTTLLDFEALDQVFYQRGQCALGDIDGDRVPDFVVTTIPSSGTYYRAISGATGAILHSLGTAGTPLDAIGPVLALDDVDGDGVRDFALGASGDSAGGTRAGEVQIRSGADGGLLQSYVGVEYESLGFDLTRLGDLDGDGIAEIALGNGGNSAFPDTDRVHIVSPGTATRLDVLTGQPGNTFYRQSVTAVDDVDGDGVGDFAIGHSVNRMPDGTAYGTVELFSGATRASLWRVDRPGGLLFGYDMATIHDQDGDGLVDIAVGAPWAEPTTPNERQGAVYVLSSATGAELQLIPAPAPLAGQFDLFGKSLSGDGDINGDGIRDLVISAINEEDPITGEQGAVHVLHGEDLQSMMTLRGRPANSSGYWHVDHAGDLNGDGRDEFFFGTRGGFKRVVTFDGTGLPYCSSTANSTGLVGRVRTFHDRANAPAGVELALDQLPSGVPGMVIVSETPGFSTPPFPSLGTICLGGAIARLNAPGEVFHSDTAGSARVLIDPSSIPVPTGATPILPGSTWHFQAWFRDTHPLFGAVSNTTAAIAVTFR